MNFTRIAIFFAISKSVAASPCIVPRGDQVYPELRATSQHLSFLNNLSPTSDGKKISLEFTKENTQKVMLVLGEGGVIWEGKRLCGWDSQDQYRRLKGCPNDLPIKTSNDGAYTVSVFVEITQQNKGLAKTRYRGTTLDFRPPPELLADLHPPEALQRKMIHDALKAPQDNLTKFLDSIEKCINGNKPGCFPDIMDDGSKVSKQQVLAILKNRKYPQIRFWTELKHEGAPPHQITIDSKRVIIDDSSCLTMFLEKNDKNWRITEIAPNGA
ncbi:MAG: hypothetical protein HY537_18360 [Deltaproteobacteria bacterium]|nr:hypothetical protein [Deltaproteobacteria bacterium]